MPVYDYRCSSCSTQLDKLVKNSEQEVICPDCGDKMLKQISAANFRVYGEGFINQIKNDYIWYKQFKDIPKNNIVVYFNDIVWNTGTLTRVNKCKSCGAIYTDYYKHSSHGCAFCGKDNLKTTKAVMCYIKYGFLNIRKRNYWAELIK